MSMLCRIISLEYMHMLCIYHTYCSLGCFDLIRLGQKGNVILKTRVKKQKTDKNMPLLNRTPHTYYADPIFACIVES